MTVQNTVVKNTYVGNLSTTVFPYTFDVNSEHPEHVVVYITGTDGKTAVTDNYTLDMTAKTVTYPKSGALLGEGQKITIYRRLPYTQLLNLINQGAFFAENIESAFDDCVFMIQQLAEAYTRALVLDVSKDVSNFDLTIPFGPNKALKINADGTGFSLTDDPAEVVAEVQALYKQIEAELASLQNTNVEELKILVEQAKQYALVAENAALINTRYVIATQDRGSLTDYGLSNANLFALPENIINIETTSTDEGSGT